MSTLSSSMSFEACCTASRRIGLVVDRVDRDRHAAELLAVQLERQVETALHLLADDAEAAAHAGLEAELDVVRRVRVCGQRDESGGGREQGAVHGVSPGICAIANRPRRTRPGTKGQRGGVAVAAPASSFDSLRMRKILCGMKKSPHPERSPEGVVEWAQDGSAIVAGARRCDNPRATPEERAMFAKLNHLAIVSENYAAERPLLRGHVRHEDLVARPARKRRGRGGRLSRAQHQSAPARPRRRLDHFGVEVEDVETVFDRMRKKYPKVEWLKRPVEPALSPASPRMTPTAICSTCRSGHGQPPRRLCRDGRRRTSGISIISRSAP